MPISSTLRFNRNNNAFTPIDGKTYEKMSPIDTAIGINNTADLMNVLNISTQNDVNIDRDRRIDAILDPAQTESFIKKALLQFGLNKTKIDSYGINNIIKNNDKADIGNRNVGITERELVTILSVLETKIEKNVFDTVATKSTTNSEIVVQSVPKNIVQKFNLDTSYYKKYANAEGIPIVTASDVPDADIKASAKLLNDLLKGHNDIRKKLIDSSFRIILHNHAYLEPLLVPEFKGNSDNFFTGDPKTGTPVIVVTSNSKKNYNGPLNAIAHEIIHAMDLAGFQNLSTKYPTYKSELDTLYKNAVTDSKKTGSNWLNANGDPRYGLQSKEEFLTQIVGNFYGADRSLTSSQAEFKRKYPGAYAFVKKYYGEKQNLVIPPFG